MKRKEKLSVLASTIKILLLSVVLVKLLFFYLDSREEKPNHWQGVVHETHTVTKKSNY